MMGFVDLLKPSSQTKGCGVFWGRYEGDRNLRFADEVSGTDV